MIFTKQLLTLMGEYMPYVSAAWLVIGLVSLIGSIWSVLQSRKKLGVLNNIAVNARSSNHNEKLKLREEVVLWADKHAPKSLSRWIYTVHNAVVAGGMADASALTDAIWSQERERFRLFKYICRYSVMVGLLFTSAGLCLTLMSVGPALQASGLDPDAWMRTVQTAMAGALGGMSTAFYSSLYAIITALILNLLGLITLYPLHDSYLARMDAFIQGRLVPLFTSIAEKDRNDVISLVMDQTERALKEVQRQYEEALEHFKSQQSLLNQSTLAVNRIAGQLTQDIYSFSNEVTILSEATRNMKDFSKPIAHAIEKGLQAVRDAQVTSNKQFAEMQSDLFEPFTKAIAEQFSQQQRHTQQVFNDMQTVTDQITILNTKMTGSLQQMTDDLREQSEVSSKSSAMMANSVESLSQSMKSLVVQQTEFMSEQSSALTVISNEQVELVASLKEGVDSISLNKAQMAEKITELFKVHSKAIEVIYRQIQERLDDVMEKLASQGLMDFQEIYNQGLKDSILATQNQLTGLQGMFDGLVSTQNQTTQVMSTLAQSLAVNEEIIKDNFTARQHILEDLLQRVAELSAHQVSKHSDAAMKSLNQQIETIFNSSLSRQEQLVQELNETLSKKWDDLLTAASHAVVV